MREVSSLYALNRGVVSHLGLARIDVKRAAMAAQQQTNWMPRVLGSMSLRPGLGYIGGIYGNAAERMLKFIFSTNDTALLELTDSLMRVWINDTLLTRPTVTSAVSNGTFPSALTDWTDNDEGSAASTWVAPNYMQLVGTGTSRAIRRQTVTIATQDTEHALRIVVPRGPVTLRVGSTSGGDELIKETTLLTGTHSLAFTPNIGSFYIEFSSRLAQKVWVSNCTIEAAGVVTLPTPWLSADLQNVRSDQSGDVLFVACAGHQQRRIERRGVNPGGRSWSVVTYAPTDGPFLVQNVTPMTLTASAITGNITITASAPLFKTTHVGALFSITSVGQQVTATSAASAGATASIRVTGIADARAFTIIVAGDATASTVDLQRSYDNATWANVATQQWTADVTASYNDTLDNQIVYYRLILTTRVAPDSVTMTLQIGSGSVRGIARVTDYGSSTSVSAEVVYDLGGTSATENWEEGQWSDKRGWPTSVKFHEGRLWWAGLNGIWGSISDAYDAFDGTYVGNAGPINRTIGSGPVDTINWLLSLKGLLLGAEGAEFSARASSLDEPLTPTNFNIKASSTQGSGSVDAVKVDQAGYFVNRSSTKIFGLSFDLREYDFSSSNIMELCPEIGQPGIVRLDCQRLPDTRLHAVKSDGTALVAVISRSEDVLAWIPIETDGVIEDVVILPAIDGDLDDQVYYVVRRTINGSDVRYLEKWAQEIDCRGGSSCMLADSYVAYSGIRRTVLTGLSHLEGESVVVWADGVDIGTDDSATTWTQRYTVSGGQITLPTGAIDIVVGLPYTATFQSAKLGSAAQVSPLNAQKKIHHIGLIMADMHPRGIRFGADFDTLDDMPLIEDGIEIGTATQTDYDQNLIEFPGTWTTDLRICLKAQAPRPCTVLAVTMDAESNR
jgi:hypothetical protein